MLEISNFVSHFYDKMSGKNQTKEGKVYVNMQFENEVHPAR